MENLKENYNKILQLNKANYKLKKENEALLENATQLYHNNIEEYKKRDLQIKKNKEIEKLNNIKIALLKNNIQYLFKMDFEGIKTEIINVYNTKNIGPKTKEKLQNIIKDYFKNNFNVNISCYINYISNYSGPLGLEITLDFLDKEGYKSFVFSYDQVFRITFMKYNYNNCELVVSYYNNIDHYIPIEDIAKEAKKLIKEYNKAKKQIEKLYNMQKEIYHGFTDYLNGFLSENLKLEEKLLLYY